MLYQLSYLATAEGLIIIAARRAAEQAWLSSGIRNPQSAIRNPQSAIRMVRYLHSPPFFSRTSSSGSVVL